MKSIDAKSNNNISETSINMNNINSSTNTKLKSLKKIKCKKCIKCNCIGKKKWFLIAFIMIIIMIILISLTFFLVIKKSNIKNNSKNKIKTSIIYNGIIKLETNNSTITNIINNNKTRNIILVPADAELVR